MQQFEYKIIENTKGIITDKADTNPEERLNELGGDGWELTESIETALGVGTKTAALVLKRPKE